MPAGAPGLSILVHLGPGVTPVHALLGERFELSDAAYVSGSKSGPAHGQVGLPSDGLALWARGRAAAEAVRLCLEQPGSIKALVLESPVIDAELEQRLGEVEVRTLVLFGADDENSQRGGMYKERMRACNFIIVYGAGSEIARDRPEAFANLVTEFLERGDRFVVSSRPSLISP